MEQKVLEKPGEKKAEDKEERAGVLLVRWCRESATGIWGSVLNKIRSLLPAVPSQARNALGVRVATGEAPELAAWSSRSFRALPTGEVPTFAERFVNAGRWLANTTERRPGLMGTVYVLLALLLGWKIAPLLRHHFQARALSADLPDEFHGSRLYGSPGDPDRLPVLYGIAPGPVGQDLLTPPPGAPPALVPVRPGTDAKGFYLRNFDALNQQYSAAFGGASQSAAFDPMTDLPDAGSGGSGVTMGPPIAPGTANPATQSKSWTASVAYLFLHGHPGMESAGLPNVIPLTPGKGGTLGTDKAGHPMVIPDAEFLDSAGAPPNTVPHGVRQKDLVQTMINMFNPGDNGISTMMGNLQVTGTITHDPGSVPFVPGLSNYDGQAMRQSTAMAELAVTNADNIAATGCVSCGVEKVTNESRGTYYGEKIDVGY